MSQPTYKLRSPADAPSFVEHAPLPDVDPKEDAPEISNAEADPYYYGWRERWEKTPRRLGELCRLPLSPGMRGFEVGAGPELS
ncbi:MAG: hypothetical protein GY835_25150 [bacterium]|nr:hypothetical protein [bacterium]